MRQVDKAQCAAATGKLSGDCLDGGAEARLAPRGSTPGTGEVPAANGAWAFFEALAQLNASRAGACQHAGAGMQRFGFAAAEPPRDHSPAPMLSAPRGLLAWGGERLFVDQLGAGWSGPQAQPPRPPAFLSPGLARLMGSLSGVMDEAERESGGDLALLFRADAEDAPPRTGTGRVDAHAALAGAARGVAQEAFGARASA